MFQINFELRDILSWDTKVKTDSLAGLLEWALEFSSLPILYF